MDGAVDEPTGRTYDVGNRLRRFCRSLSIEPFAARPDDRNLFGAVRNRTGRSDRVRQRDHLYLADRA